MSLQILIADNNPVTLDTTSQFFEKAGFDIIPVETPRAAQLVIKYNSALAAIVLDVRLADDDDERDLSGLDLAMEVREDTEARAPIIIYSRLDYSRQIRGANELPADIKGVPSPISFVSKEDGPEALVAKVKEQINLSMFYELQEADITRYSKPPVIIFDEQSYAGRLQAELLKYDVHSQRCSSLSELKEVAPFLPWALFVVDVTAGGSGQGEEAIEFLEEYRGVLGRPFYVAALTAGGEDAAGGSQTVSDIFLVKDKDSAEIDALEVVTRISQLKIEMEKAAAEEPQTQLALRQYERLTRQLGEIKESPAGRRGAAATDTVRKALNWPFLTPREKLILTTLYTRLLAAEEFPLDAKTIDLCIQGAAMLADDRARHADVQAWLTRTQMHSVDFTPSWLDEEFFDDDPEEDDEESD